MISFLLDEGVITVGTLSGLFTTALLNSLKRNIIDPSIERIAPSHKLDNPPSKDGESKSGFSDMFPIPTGPMPDGQSTTTIRWQTFLKDLITWIVIMFFLYLFWKFVLNPNKMSKFGSK
jgi:large-conductance mechanosensitive channel